MLDDSRVLLFRVLPLCIGAALIPPAMKRIFQLLGEWEIGATGFVTRPPSEVRGLFDRHFSDFVAWPGPLYLGSLMTIVGMVSFAASNTFSNLHPGLATVGWAASAFGLFIAGAGLASVYALVRLVRAVGRFPVRVYNHRFGVMSTGHLLQVCFFIVAVIWFCYGVAAAWQFRGAVILIGVFSIPTGLFLIGAFIHAQQPIHRQMLDYKREQLIEVESRLHALMSSTKQFDESSRQEIEFLRELLKELQSLPEWPFRWASLLGVIASAVGAVSPAIIGHFAPGLLGLLISIPGDQGP